MMMLCVAARHAQQAGGRPQGPCHVLSVAPPQEGYISRPWLDLINRLAPECFIGLRHVQNYERGDTVGKYYITVIYNFNLKGKKLNVDYGEYYVYRGPNETKNPVKVIFYWLNDQKKMSY